MPPFLEGAPAAEALPDPPPAIPVVSLSIEIPRNIPESDGGPKIREIVELLDASNSGDAVQFLESGQAARLCAAAAALCITLIDAAAHAAPPGKLIMLRFEQKDDDYVIHVEKMSHDTSAAGIRNFVEGCDMQEGEAESLSGALLNGHPPPGKRAWLACANFAAGAAFGCFFY